MRKLDKSPIALSKDTIAKISTLQSVLDGFIVIYEGLQEDKKNEYYKTVIKPHIGKYNEIVEYKEALKSLGTIGDDLYCGYCETRINNSYMDIEHIIPKHKNWKMALDWNNLIPACEKCNRTYKHTRYDVRLLNPSEPSYNFNDYFCFKESFLYQGIDVAGRGKCTIDIINLNDTRIDLENPGHAKKERIRLLSLLRRTIKNMSSHETKDNIKEAVSENKYEHGLFSYADWLVSDDSNSPLHSELY